MKNIIITGSTDGIGKLAAIQLAKAGHAVYIHGRNSEKLARVIEEIKSLSNNENVSGFVADFSDLIEVKAMAKKIASELSSIDVLINNAGVFKSAARLNKDGLDLRMVVNYLAPHLLTEELMPLLEKGTATRLINLSSAAQASVSLEVLSGKQAAAEQETYAQSKLALTMWSFYLAEKHKNIAVIAVNPGSLLNTNMVREAYGRHWSSADKGATILCELATSEEHSGITGKYFDNDREGYGQAHTDAYDPTKIEQLIELTKSITNFHR